MTITPKEIKTWAKEIKISHNQHIFKSFLRIISEMAQETAGLDGQKPKELSNLFNKEKMDYITLFVFSCFMKAYKTNNNKVSGTKALNIIVESINSNKTNLSKLAKNINNLIVINNEKK